jgi:hypothetical protein
LLEETVVLVAEERVEILVQTVEAKDQVFLELMDLEVAEVPPHTKTLQPTTLAEMAAVVL